MESKKIKEAYFNDNPPDKYNYVYIDVRFDDNERDLFFYHVNNPFPKKEEIIGLTWVELQNLYYKMFQDYVNKWLTSKLSVV